MDPIWISAAFILGFIASRMGLPPLVGYLVAGFTLNYFGAEGGEGLKGIGDLGVTLLLFGIGLKLRLRSLIQPEVWGGATLHLLATILIFGIGIFGLGVAGITVFAQLDWSRTFLMAFALSFSSTVFAVKVLEARGEMGAFHGRVSIGILIMQDIFAVLFLTLSTGKIPSPWALLLPVMLLGLRPILTRVLDRVGHRELLLLFGTVLAVGVGAGGFELLGLKGDLGALVLGMMVSTHPKSNELSRVLLSLKDLFLVGFFLNVGLSDMPALSDLGIAALLALLIPVKTSLYFLILTRFRLRARTSILTAFSLANYSEFGLLVTAIAVQNGWIDNSWLIILAMALSISFILASPLNSAAHTLNEKLGQFLKRFETPALHPNDQPIDPGDAEILIFGMGRVGTVAYEIMRERYGKKVVGLDFNPDAVKYHRDAGRVVIQDDATDPDFWEKIRPERVRLVMLAMPDHAANMFAARQLAKIRFAGRISATARFDDQVKELEAAGVSAAYNLYAEAGSGFAEHTCEHMGSHLNATNDASAIYCKPDY